MEILTAIFVTTTLLIFLVLSTVYELFCERAAVPVASYCARVAQFLALYSSSDNKSTAVFYCNIL